MMKGESERVREGEREGERGGREERKMDGLKGGALLVVFVCIPVLLLTSLPGVSRNQYYLAFQQHRKIRFC